MHTLEGSPTITCGADGRWSSGPACVLIECDDPPTIDEATFFDASPYTPGDMATYTCSETHALNGPNQITCGADGTWSAGPVCILKFCPPPPSIPLGTFSPYQDTYMPSETVTYECCNGITITDTSGTTNTCGGGGTWTLTGASLPSCTPTGCPPPPIVLQGDVQSTDQKLTYAFNEMITYECNFSPKAGQTPSNTCGADGLWTNHSPDICEES
uniref:Sushi, von Willebrand factor type A, EGF and pentraxin domain-containing protein 1-like n=1 Tax=Phallusia mammillata TaxID=59560 RepID=A0A6F9DU76_9ASCI|nr:sushi, von Willebrand factor type A, EGF and pentraxin domain-containing protein 1-like [Phallusia mammillata]